MTVLAMVHPFESVTGETYYNARVIVGELKSVSEYGDTPEAAKERMEAIVKKLSPGAKIEYAQ